MSTVDPVLARKQRDARRPGPARIAVVLLLLLVGGVALGYGWTRLALIDGDGELPSPGSSP